MISPSYPTSSIESTHFIESTPLVPGRWRLPPHVPQPLEMPPVQILATVSMYLPQELPVHLQKSMFTMKFYMVSQLRIRLHPQNIPLSHWMGITAHNLTCRAKRLQVCPFAWWKIAASLPGLIGIPQKEGPNWHALRRLTGFQGLNMS
jgi:hypothetical protein